MSCSSSDPCDLSIFSPMRGLAETARGATEAVDRDRAVEDDISEFETTKERTRREERMRKTRKVVKDSQTAPWWKGRTTMSWSSSTTARTAVKRGQGSPAGPHRLKLETNSCKRGEKVYRAHPPLREAGSSHLRAQS